MTDEHREYLRLVDGLAVYFLAMFLIQFSAKMDLLLERFEKRKKEEQGKLNAILDKNVKELFPN